ncbi:hypothetical protein [Rhodopseudomonas sp. P2A-2r]|uniref:hypothetical protein n=1 Tax=Rhodopseudomonas sp. P2A-2r TaxID=2991972 RepID=UPI0029FF193D|nr:hypothetical protein [Rhodopseudomonas sp. P2A-2r]
MTPIQTKRALRTDLLLAGAMVVAGSAIALASVVQLKAHDPQVMAQATPPLQSTPGAASKPAEPAEPATTGARPHDIPRSLRVRTRTRRTPARNRRCRRPQPKKPRRRSRQNEAFIFRPGVPRPTRPAKREAGIRRCNPDFRWSRNELSYGARWLMHRHSRPPPVRVPALLQIGRFQRSCSARIAGRLLILHARQQAGHRFKRGAGLHFERSMGKSP